MVPGRGKIIGWGLGLRRPRDCLEAVSAPDASMGRTLGGDIPFSHIASKNSFVLDASALKNASSMGAGAEAEQFWK